MRKRNGKVFVVPGDEEYLVTHYQEYSGYLDQCVRDRLKPKFYSDWCNEHYPHVVLR